MKRPWKLGGTRFLTTAAAMLTLSACVITTPVFNQFSGGVLEGKVALGWNDTTSFVYYPVEGNPLRYKLPKDVKISSDDRVNNSDVFTTIRPQLMFTDAGSIPRSFWNIRGLSPLDYLPAFILHDWLYLESRCWKLKKGYFWKLNQSQGLGLTNYPYTRAVADKILFDALDAVDANRPQGKEIDPADAKRAKRLIKAAVQSFGGSSFGKEERCDIPPGRTTVKERTFNERVKVKVSRRTPGGIRPESAPLPPPRFKTVNRQRRVKETVPTYRTIRVF